MRFSLFITSLFCVLVRSAESLNDVPTCGLLCIGELTIKSTCDVTNTTCICTNVQLNEEISACVASNCTIRESLGVEKYSKDSCGVAPRDRTTQVMVVGLTFGSLALIAFVLRIWSRINGSGGRFEIDDYVMGVSMCILIPFCSFSVVLAKHGLGRDIWNVSFEDIGYVSYIYYWDELMYLAALPLTKISILFFYLRIFPNKTFQYGTYILIALNIGYLIAFECISIWQCRPLEAAWKRWDGTYPAKCNNINLQSWMSAAINIILDLGILVLPMPELFKLNMSTKKKIHILCMFSVGIFVTIVSCLRLHTLIEFGNTKNMTQDYVDLGVWSTVEVPVGVICACMPAIRSLFRNVFPTLLGQTKQDSNSVAGSMPRLEKSTASGIGLGMGKRNSSKPTHGDEGSFVQLVELESGRRKD